MKKAMILILVLFIQFSFGQGNMTKFMQRIVNDKVTSGIDSVMVLRTYSEYYSYYGYPVDSSESESVQYEKRCESPDAFYILYWFQGANYVQKMGDCYMSQPVLLDKSKSFLFLLTNFDIISKETIVNFIEETETDNPLKDSEWDHRTAIYISLKSHTKGLFWYDLDLLAANRNGNKNIHYESNSQAKTIELAKWIEEDIKDIVFRKQLPSE